MDNQEFKGFRDYIEKIAPPNQTISFGCIVLDIDGRWYYPIYTDGKLSGKSYTDPPEWANIK